MYPKYSAWEILDFAWNFHSDQYPGERMGQAWMNRKGGEKSFPELYYTNDPKLASRLIWENFCAKET